MKHEHKPSAKRRWTREVQATLLVLAEEMRTRGEWQRIQRMAEVIPIIPSSSSMRGVVTQAPGSP